MSTLPAPRVTDFDPNSPESAAKRQLLRAEAKAASLVNEVASLCSLCAAAEQDRDVALEKAASLAADLVQLAAHHKALLNSTSWRLTRPIRGAITLLHRLRR